MPYGPLLTPVEPGTILFFAVTPATLPPLVPTVDLTTLVACTFSVSLDGNGSSVLSWTGAIATNPPATSTLAYVTYTFAGNEFGGVTGTWYVTPTVKTLSGQFIDVDPDTLFVRNKWGNR